MALGLKLGGCSLGSGNGIGQTCAPKQRELTRGVYQCRNSSGTGFLPSPECSSSTVEQLVNRKVREDKNAMILIVHYKRGIQTLEGAPSLSNSDTH
jgi:hypothetical protein